jgi:LysR family transcriptional regulator, nitrogen assimilation regulatory protein
MNFKQIHYFVAVAEAGGFSKAAYTIPLAQSALSRHIRLLEDEFGTKLLTRNGRGVALTEQGEFLYVRAKEILDQKKTIEQALTNWYDFPHGPVRIGLPPSIVLSSAADIIGSLHIDHPAIEVSLSENLSSEIGKMVYSGRLDLGVMLEQRPVENLEAELLGFEELCLVTARTLLIEEPVSFESIAEMPLILPTKNGRIRATIEHAAARAEVQLNVVFKLDSLTAIKDLVKKGSGVAILSRSAVERDLKAEEVNAYKISAKNIKLPVYLVYPSDAPLSRAATAAAVAIRTRLQTIKLAS